MSSRLGGQVAQDRAPRNVLEAQGLRVAAGGRDQTVNVVEDVTISVGEGENVGLVGPPGVGKSMVARLMAGLVAPDRGTVRFEGTDLATRGRKDLDRIRARIPLVPQDLTAAMPRRVRVGRVVDQALDLVRSHHEDRRELVRSALAALMLPAEVAGRRVGDLPPPERARVALARALILRPRVVVTDELTQGLSHQQTAELVELVAELGLLHRVSYLFVSRDLAAAEFLCDRLVVMDGGRVVDQGVTDQVMKRPLHPSSAALVAAARAARPARGPDPGRIG